MTDKTACVPPLLHQLPLQSLSGYMMSERGFYSSPEMPSAFMAACSNMKFIFQVEENIEWTGGCKAED